MTQVWIVAGIVFVAGALLIVGLSLAWEAWMAGRRQRAIVGRMRPGESEPAAEGTPAGDLFHPRTEEKPGVFKGLLDGLPIAEDFQTLLDQAGGDWSPARFVAMTIASVVIVGTVAWLALGPLVAAPFAIAAATIPYMVVKRRKRKRLDAFEQSFPEAIDLLGRAIRAGHAFSTGLQMVADESPEPIAGEFRQIFEEHRYGLPLEDALLAMSDRIGLMDVRIFVTAVLIQREVGGNLAEILDNLSNTIRERFTIQRQVRVYTAQGRFTGYLLAALPIALGFIIFAMNPEYMSVLWTEPTGRMMMAVAVMLQLIGYVVIRRIVDIEV